MENEYDNCDLWAVLLQITFWILTLFDWTYPFALHTSDVVYPWCWRLSWRQCLQCAAECSPLVCYGPINPIWHYQDQCWSWKNKTSKYNINLSFHIYFCFIYVCVLKKHNQRVSKWTMLTYMYIRFQNIWYHDLTWTYRLTKFIIGYDRAFFMVHVQI